VWGSACGVSAFSLGSPAARRAIDGALARFGRAVGSVLGAVLLTLVYVIVVTPTRFVRRLTGADDLHLRDADRASYWLPCDTDARKVRYVGAMFATEVRRSGGHPLRTALILAASFVLLAEGIARMFGFGHPVLYVADPDVGYYPEPDVHVVRYGGLVATNRFGMRSPDVTPSKPPGVFRILMLGDSTLWGGSYIDQEDLYSSQLLARMNSEGLPGKVEVLAMSANGWGPFHERGFVKKFGVFGADLALIQMPIDDINRPLYGLMSVPFFATGAPPRFALEEEMNTLIWSYRSRHAGLDERWELRQSQYGIHEYGRLADDLHGAGCEVMLFLHPTQSPGFGGDEGHREATWTHQLEDTLAEHGVKVQLARGVFAGKGTVKEIYYDNMHLNPTGHHVYAEFIEGRIKADSTRFQRWASGQLAEKDRP
jgi:hypothetical protein